MIPSKTDGLLLNSELSSDNTRSKIPFSSPLPSSSSSVTMSSFQTTSSVSIPTTRLKMEQSPTPSSGSTPMPPLLSRDSNNPEFSDDSDDELQDWSLLNSISKKGNKDFEPLLTDNENNQLSLYDQNKLNKSRNMRFNALAVKRGSIVNLENLMTSTIYINSENHNDLFMLQPKGKFLETMGIIDNNNICHFGFEEVLYLVERGSCMLKFWDISNTSKNQLYQEMPPLSLQSAYSLLITGEERLNQYLVYSILKRDGYIILRNEEFEGKISSPDNKIIKSNEDLLKNVKMSWYTNLLCKISEFFKIDFPFKFAFSYFNIFTYLHSKIIKQSLSPELSNISKNNEHIKHYKISFNIWKPSPSFKKKNPPPPDYQISVFNSTQRLPKYSEIKSLLERSNSNPNTHKPKPKVKIRKSKPEDSNNNTSIKLKLLENSWDYSKGIDISNLKYDPHRITLAIVDNATVNFITLSHCSFVSEGPVWRDHWVTWRPPQKKKRNNYNNNNSNNNRRMQPKNSKNLQINTENNNNDFKNSTAEPPKSAYF